MGGFVKKYAPMMGVISSDPAPIMGTFLEILPPLGVKMANFLQNDPILVHYGWVSCKFCTCDGCLFHNLPQMDFASVAIYRVSTPTWDGGGGGGGKGKGGFFTFLKK